jgi:F0F1-type ATP synthase delta subunit
MSMNSAKQIRLAKRYARALFEVSDPLGFDNLSEQLKLLAAVWKESSDFREVMQNPAIQESTRLEVLAALAAKAPR